MQFMDSFVFYALQNRVLDGKNRGDNAEKEGPVLDAKAKSKRNSRGA